MTSQGHSSTPPAQAQRDHLIDAVRALSVLVVVIFHAGLWRVSRTSDGGFVARTMELERGAGTAPGSSW